jgi:hypothetical protein
MNPMSDLDQAAKVTWIVMDEMQSRLPHHPKIEQSQSRSRDFESVKNAVLFVMEKLSGINRTSAMIHTDTRAIQMAEIEVLYSQIKRA